MEELKLLMDAELVGHVRNWKLIADDIYFVAGEHNEGYVVPISYAGSVLSPKALAFGERRGDLLYYLDGERWPIARHELLLWQLARCAENERKSLQEKLHSCCMYGRMEFPDFFGSYPAPAETPAGTAEELRKVRDGIYFVRSNNQWFFALCEPIWFPELSIAAHDYGTHCRDYLFFAVAASACAIPIFEL